ncbi:MAG: hypothetical protein CVV47_13920 [Spirochaetae bacterium HGW-Spirochaetae-3]|jgi:hypothetical protein|nr:MAG: hypothetical protein CVV47_13920 [Spirochaetae bacterium HGW-Spirochaetae-3]
MAKDTNVLDYNKQAVRSAIVEAFKKRRGEAAPADIVAFTGLPKPQVDAELPAVADEFGGRLKVTESGEILYSFPDGLRSRYRGFGPGLRRFLRASGKGAVAVGTFLFKAWIMVMLVGYFALFVALVVLALLASVAASASDRNGKSRSRGGGLALTGRLVDLFVRIWFYNEVFKSPGQRRYQAGARARTKENRRPLNKAIFSFVFGEPDPNADHDAVEKRAFVALARARKGVVLLEDFMAVTGLSPEAADTAINRYLYEFEGSPEVSDNGTVYFHFPKLLLRARSDDSGAADSPFRRLRPFSANATKSNVWYAAINGANLAFGSYFLYCSLSAAALSQRPVTGGTYLFWFVASLLSELVSNPLGIVAIGLGVVPIVFSILFWAVPALRAGSVARENERIKRQNMSRTLYSAALSSPSAVRVPAVEALPAVARPSDASVPRRVLEGLAAYEGAEPIDGDAWRMVELERKVSDVERVRASVRPEDYRLGGVAFDSGS